MGWRGSKFRMFEICLTVSAKRASRLAARSPSCRDALLSSVNSDVR